MKSARADASYLIDGLGLWSRATRRESLAGRPAVFLDRDGVLVDEVHFLRDPADVGLTPGVAEAICRLNSADIAVVVVTNQSGIARGRLTWEAFERVQDEIVRRLALEGARVDATLACGFHSDGHGALAIADHPWRKPRPGMLLEAARLLGVNLQASLMVGDRLSDLEAGWSAGAPDAVLVRTGYGEEQRSKLPAAVARRAGQNIRGGVANNAAAAINAWIATRKSGL